MTEAEAREAAHGLLIAAGFELKYTAPSGSRYYHLSGRRGGMLRLADHARQRSYGAAAHLTIHADCCPKSNEKLRNMVGRAIGWYIMGTVSEPHPPDNMQPRPAHSEGGG